MKDHSPEDCPMVDIVNFRFGNFSSEPPKDLYGRPLGPLRGSRNPLRGLFQEVKVFTWNWLNNSLIYLLALGASIFDKSTSDAPFWKALGSLMKLSTN